jgi:hypothetical protein
MILQKHLFFSCLFDLSRPFKNKMPILLVDLEMLRLRLECASWVVALYVARLVFDEIDPVSEFLPT